jgi:hypothetical protein
MILGHARVDYDDHKYLPRIAGNPQMPFVQFHAKLPLEVAQPLMDIM